mgnify:CR=1 FL=1
MIAPFADLDARALKTMSGELVSAVGGSGAAAKIMKRLNERGELVDLSVGRVSGYCTVSDMNRFLTVADMVRLEIAAGHPIVSKWAGDRLARDGSNSPGALCQQSAYLLRRSLRELAAEVDDAMVDNTVSSAERAAIREDILQVEIELAKLKARVAMP